MHIILGANGHVGSETANFLLEKGEPVTVVIHSDHHKAAWKEKGAMVEVADVLDTAKLKAVYAKGDIVFLLNPPAPFNTDTVKEERRSIDSLLKALHGSGIKRVVAQSTYGAQAGEGIGDLGVLYEMEQKLTGIDIPCTIIRAAYYMSNWDMSLETARNEGVVHTFYPVDFTLPMISPRDLGYFAASFLMQSEPAGLQFVEGPELYSPNDVAQAFSKALNKRVKAVETPPEQWLTVLQQSGFSKPAAQSMAAMTKLTKESKFQADSPLRGKVSLQEYINGLVKHP